MTVDTAAVPENKKTNLSITKRDRRDVIRQVREITGLDENAINQTIEACKDGTGRYSLEQVISLLFDDTNLRNNLQRSPQSSQNSSPSNCNVPVPAISASVNPHPETITDDVIEISADIDQQAAADDDLERALQLSRETMEQTIDESDIAERKSLNEPAGLKNIGNTCWFNSVVQVLYTLPYFRQLIFNFQYPTLNHPISESEHQALGFTEELRFLFALMLKSPRRSINPERSLKKFKTTRKLSGGDFSQEDCSEFAIHLIELLELAYETIGKSVDNNTSMTFSNPINTLVTGEVIAERNEHISIREALRQINIQMNDSSNLYDGLESLWLGSADESLCSQQINGEQRWLTRLPPVLFICLNRYRFSQTTKQTSKIIAPFQFYPELYLDRYMLANKDLILSKRARAKTLYAQLHQLETTLNNYLQYPCNNESFALANAIRVVYEYATGGRLYRTDSVSSERTQPVIPIHPSHITNDELQFIQTTLPTWLTEIESKCAAIREDIQRLKNELKQLYDEPQLKQTRYKLHAVCVHEGSANLGHFWTYVYHSDSEKWYRYNDNEVCATTWQDVFDAGIGGQNTDNDRDHPRVPSAYLLVYTNAEEKSLSQDTSQCELSVDLQRVLDDDYALLQQQIESVKLEQLYNELKSLSDHLEKQPNAHRVLTLPFFTGQNPTSDSELVKPVLDSTLRILRQYAPKILTVDVDRLLQEIVEKEMKSHSYTSNMLSSVLPFQDYRLQHILCYFSVNRVDHLYRQRVMYDIIRLTPVPNEDLRLRILKLQAQIICHDIEMSNEQVQEYQKILTDYKDYRSIIAAFLAGYQLLNEDKFEEAITYFCVACEFNLRLSKQCSYPMRAMDSCLLFKSRRLCFERWNDMVINRFKTDPEYRLDSMTHQFLPCLMQLKLSSEDDQAYINEIQRVRCLLLDKLEPTERSLSLEEFLQRLLEQPVGQHYHSVSINKHQLIERYDEAVRDLQHRYPTFFTYSVEQTSSTNRLTRLFTASALTPVTIPVHIEQDPRPSDPLQIDNARSSSPMQQGDDEPESLPSA